MKVVTNATHELRRGLNRLKLGALFYITAFILAFVGIAAIFSLPGVFSLITQSFSEELSGSPALPGLPGYTPRAPLIAIHPKLLAVLGVSALLLLIAGILGVISFVLWFMATGDLKRYRKRLGIGRTGMILQILAVIIIIVCVVGLIAFSAVSAGQLIFEKPLFGASTVMMVLGVLGVVVIGAILAIIGSIMFGLMLMRMPEEGLDSGFKKAGIIYLVGMVTSLIPFVSLISWILDLTSAVLVYRSSKRSLESLHEGTSFLLEG